MHQEKLVTIIKGERIAVIPTDTIYGIVGSAFSKKTVERIYAIKKRNPQKPYVILIGQTSDLDQFDITLDKRTKAFLKKIWPGKVSIILPCLSKNFYYLHRGTNSLAFRLPKKQWLKRLIKKTGPLVAPSANPEGLPTAKTIEEARNYFSNQIDLYVDDGKLESFASTLISIKNGQVKILRQEEGKIKTDQF